MISFGIALAMSFTTSVVVSAQTPHMISNTVEGKSNFDKNNSDNSWNKPLGNVYVDDLCHATMNAAYYDNLVTDKTQTYISNCPYGIYRWSYVASGGGARTSNDGVDVKEGQARTDKIALKNSKAIFKIFIYS